MRARLMRNPVWPLAVVLVALLFGTASAAAQAGGCALVADPQNGSEMMLRCGQDVTIRNAPGTQYQLENQGKVWPEALELKSGAVMLEFHGGAGRPGFQILAPQAIASVRGTHWIVDVKPGTTSTFVIAGTVEVTRRNGGQSALLGPGEGADVDDGPGPVTVKHWPQPRVKALLSRFGQ